jgi:hypothetical protein
MSPDQTSATVVLLASDALEACGEKGAQAALLLMDAALSIMVTCHTGAGALREMAGMLAQRLIQQVEGLIEGGAA